MQPTTTWGTPTGYYLGLNTRTGASDLSNADFNDYPAFILGINNNFPLSDKGIVQSFIETDTLQLNTPITDWSIAYTAVDNPELGQNNVGVYLNDPDTPAYTTDPNNLAKIAFLSSYSYTTILENISVNIPNFTNFTLDFWAPPYSSSRKIWAPNAAPKSGSSDMGIVYQQANYNGYANILYSFGIKSLFLEIRVDSVNINDKELNQYSLKEYNELTDEEKAENPIAKAYARVYRRANIDGTYSYASGDHRDNFRLVLSEPLRGENDGGGIYDYYINTTAYIGLTEPLILPIFGNYKDDVSDIRYNITENAANLFYGFNKVDNIIDGHADEYDRYKFYTMQGTDDNIEWIRKTCAAYGLFFCDDVIDSNNVNMASSTLEQGILRWIDSDMHLGIIEDSGYTQGRYSSGISNALQSQFNWSDSTESTYNPDVPPVPENHYSSSTTFNSIGNLATLTRRYALSGGAVSNLGKNLWKISDDIAVSDPLDPYAKYDAQILNTFLTSNPIDCIISLRRYPLTLPYGSSTTIKLGKVDTLVACYEMDEPCHTYEFRGIPIMPNFGNSFLDYAPYTEFELYVPFCGTTKLNPADILGRTLNVKLVVDFDTGTCTGYIMSNNLVIETINGSIAIDIPVTGTDSTTVQAQLSHGIITAESAKTQERMTYGKTVWPTGIVSAVLNPFGTANTFAQNEANVNKAQYDVEHTVAPSHVIGSASPVSKWAIDLNCRLIIYYPTGKCIELVNGVPQFESNELNMFGAHVGFATLDEVSHYDTYTGLVVGANPKLGQMQTQNGTRYATADELNMIRQAIEQGIII